MLLQILNYTIISVLSFIQISLYDLIHKHLNILFRSRMRVGKSTFILCEVLLSNILFLSLRYKVEVAGKSLPVLTSSDKGRYGVIVFESLSKYANMDKWNRELLDKYCREYSVGVVGFATPGEETLVGAQLKGFPLFMHTNLRLKVRSCLHELGYIRMNIEYA